MCPYNPVVSSAHLATGPLPELSELEFALITGTHAFHRWTTHAMAAAGAPGLSALDVQVLHVTHHRGRPKTIAQLCLLLNIEDTHLVTYAARKLRDKDLLQETRRGKEKTLHTTQTGAALCETYARLRRQILLDTMKAQGFDARDLSRLAALLRAVSGHYDQATRAAATL